GVALLERAEGPAAGSTTPPPPRVRFAVSHAVSTAVVTLHGVLDDRGGELLASLLRGVIDDVRTGVVVVDLRDVSGVELPAVEVFTAASGWARRKAIGFRLFGPPAALSDMLTETWLSGELDIVP